MKINRIYIKNFGGINDREYVLSDGLNIISGSNEAGKSTFLSFIRFVFFGAKRQRGKELSFREKYMPWSGEDMCGEIEFTLNGSQFSVSRTVSASGRKNQVTMFNKSTGEEVHVSADDIGAELFGMSEQAFLKTMFIASEGTQIDSDGEILAKISNIAQSGDETTSYQFIKKELDEMIAELSAPRRSKAIIPHIQNELFLLAQEKQRLSDILENQEGLLAQLCLVSEKLDKAIAEKTRLGEIKKQAQMYNDFVAYSKCSENFRQAEKDFENEKSACDRLSPDCSDRIKDITDEEEQIILGNNAEEKAASRMQQILLKDKADSSKKTGMFSALIAIVSGIGAAFFPLIGILTAIAILFCGYSFFSSAKFRKRSEAVGNELAQYDSRKKAVLDKYGLVSEEQYLRLKREFSDYGAKEELFRSKLRMANRIYEQRKAEFEDLRQVISGKYGDDGIPECTPPEESIDTIEKKITLTEQDILYFTSEKAKLKGQSDGSENCEALIAETDARIAELNTTLTDAKANLHILNLADEILGEAYQELKENFAPRLAKATAKIFEGLTGGKYGEIIVNDRFEIQIKKDGEYKNSNYFSSGTIQQLYFSLRLGIIELISGDFPLFIDDAFITYDDERFSKAADFIGNYAKHNQIVFSTCHARESGIDGAHLLKI